MSTPSPLIPQGAFPPNRGRSHIRIAVFTILAVHVVLLGALLMAGCKKTTDATDAEGTNAFSEAPPPDPATNQASSGFAQNTGFPTPPPPPPPSTFAPAPETTIITQAPLGSPTPPEGTPPPPVNNISAFPPSTTLGPNEYVILKGDSFYTIGKKYGVSYRAIADANPGVDPTRLKIGQKITVPAPSVAAAPSGGGATAMGGADARNLYTVRSGDTLMRIAKQHGVTVKALRSANSLRTDQIKVGQKLKIPAKNGAPDQMATSPPPASGAAPPPPVP